MIKAIISSYTSTNLKKTNAENNKEVSFKRNDGMSSQSNDEFIKNVEKERDSVINWANKRINKLNAILEIAKNDDELPKADKAKIAATAGDKILFDNVINAAKSPNTPPDIKAMLEKAAEFAKNHTDSQGHFSGTAVNELNSALNSAKNVSSKGHIDSDLDLYMPDPEPTDVPDADGDSCDGSDSDCDSGCDESDCLSDTADCIS